MKYLLQIFIIASTCLLLNRVKAQQYSFVPYSVEEGLAQTQVFDICTDSSGNVWFGTAGGASKFDGNNFKSYSAENGLADNSVIQLKYHNGFIWIATHTGISRIKNKQVEVYSFASLALNNNISSFDISENALWCGIKNVGVYEIPLIDNVPQLEEYYLHVPTSNLSIRSLFVSSKNEVWLGSKGYLGTYKNGEWEEVQLPNSSLNISDITEDNNNSIWISTYHEGVFNITNNDITNHNAESGLLSNLIRSVYVDNDNRIWLSSKNGVCLLENGSKREFTQNNGLENENIKVVAQDKDGNVWLGSDGSGAYKFSGDEFVNYSSTDGLAGNYVMSIVQDSTGAFWYSTYGDGLSKYYHDEFTNFNISNSPLNNNTMWSSLLDHEQNLWFGTSGGLMKYRNNQFESYVDVDWLPSNKITSLFEDSNDNIWIGTSRGVSIINDNSSKTYTDTSGLKTKNIRSIEELNKQIWLGSSDGVFIYENEVFRSWYMNDEIGNSTVYCLEKWGSKLFIGTANGLYFYDGIYVYPVNLHSSYSANYINFITLENNDYLWVGTNYGIFEIDLSLFSPGKTAGITHFTTLDGLTSSETNLNSAYQDSEGNIWMGTGKGLVKFDRNKRKHHKNNTPAVNLEDVQLFLQKTDWSEYSDSIDQYSKLPLDLSVKFKKNYFTFYFSAASINKPDEIRFKIKLDGFDEDWSPEIFQRSVTYGNLPHGLFTFKVIASTNGANWSAPAAFSFEIRKPYYLTWWFFSLSTFTVLLIIYIIWRWNSNIQNQKRDTEKVLYKSKLLALEQQTLNASMNRHFIFNALNSIQYYINTQDKVSANKYLTSFAKLIRKNLDSSSSGDSLVPLTEELERLELYISLEHMRFQNKFEYNIELGPNVQAENIVIPPMFLQPFVENSIWHGILPMDKAGKISIKIQHESPNTIKFIIEDNGIGIDTSLAKKSKHSHISKGMSLTSGRLNILKKVTNKSIHIDGPKQIENDDNQPIGTRVIITLEEN